MKTRDRYEVLPTPAAEVRAGERAWRLTRNGDVMAHADTQAEVLGVGVKLATLRWRLNDQPSELVIKGRDGRIRDSRTYGNDPRDIRG